ncbi:MAG: hypothetical protein H0X46_03185 [Bacteroidetes bacterium]|nr:hypothetical protein [Bacteroidota bacterium]
MRLVLHRDWQLCLILDSQKQNINHNYSRNIMDINDIRKTFGSMPIAMLSSAQLLQQKKNRNITLGVVAIGSLFLGGFIVYSIMKDKTEDKARFKSKF